MTEPGPGKSLDERVSELETVTRWLTNELGRLSERVHEATDVEAIIRRARQNSLDVSYGQTVVTAPTSGRSAVRA